MNKPYKKLYIIVKYVYVPQVIFYKFLYEHVCGYMLGHKSYFYNSLNKAKDTFLESSINTFYFSKLLQQSIIIELESDDIKIIKFLNIYTISSDNLTWSKKTININEVSIGALAEINRHYFTLDV